MPLSFWQASWHAELAIEFVLLVILWRKSAPRWFSILIGVDFIAGLLQVIPYRSHYPLISRSFWLAGVVIAGPLVYRSLMEAQYLDLTRLTWWHVRLLAVWVAGQLTCITLQTQADLLIPMNHALLAVDAAVFVAWITLFSLYSEQ